MRKIFLCFITFYILWIFSNTIANGSLLEASKKFSWNTTIIHKESTKKIEVKKIITEKQKVQIEKKLDGFNDSQIKKLADKIDKILHSLNLTENQRIMILEIAEIVKKYLKVNSNINNADTLPSDFSDL